jgi:hypothetical protein
MLKKLSLLASLALVAALMLPPQVWAQPPYSAAGPKTHRYYNPQRVETLSGTVVAVNRRHARHPGRPDRIMMLLKTAQGNVKVYLGPADYVDHQALKLAPGEQVQVKGVRHTYRRAIFFVASAVKKGDQVMKLRDNTTGRPLWTKAHKGQIS